MNPGKLHAMCAVLIFFVALVVFLSTVAPTVAFWDNPEFIACASIMGIPHPPGSPLLVLTGRIFSMIPFFDFRIPGFGSIAYRINLLAVFSGALSIALIYLIAVKLITRFSPFKGKMLHDSMIVLCALITGFLAAFSNQFWENAVEFETYMPALLFSLLAFWLTLKWEENKNVSGSLGYLFCAAYVSGLGIGIHLSVLLIVPALLFIVVYAKPEWFSDRRLWISFVPAAAALFTIKYFDGAKYFFVLMIFFSIAGPFFYSRVVQTTTVLWKRSAAGIILCVSLFAAGYSVYPTILVRADMKPAINQGNPDSLTRYSEYVNRAQYKQNDLSESMLDRRASFSYQLLFQYTRYLIRQFPRWGPSPAITFINDRSPENPGMQITVREVVFVPVALLFLMLFGMYTHMRKAGGHFCAFLIFFLLSSIGLVLYLNMDNPQVRERGYFFLGSFQIALMWTGIGMYGVISSVQKRCAARFVLPVTVIFAIVFASVVPVAAYSNHINPDHSNYRIHDRSNNWIAYDYALNTLRSCEKNAILFTHGDNDTFPLWYAQYVEGIRQDIRVVNLSILNAPWYIKQLRDEGERIPITFTDDFIDTELCNSSLSSYKTLLWSPAPKEISVDGLNWYMPPTYRTIDGKTGFLSVSHRMILHIIEQVTWSRPVYFSTYIAFSNLIGLEEYLSMEGMVYHLTKEKRGSGDYYVSTPLLAENMNNRYTYRGITDKAIYKSPETLRIIHNYFIGFLELLHHYSVQGKPEEALQAASRAYEFSIDEPARLDLLNQVIEELGLHEESERIFHR